MSLKSCGVYNKKGEKSGHDAWISSMLLDNDRELANKAMFKAHPQAVVPRQTLNSLLIPAKAKVNLVTPGDFHSEYDIYQRVG